ncbi:MAG: hypothetical protein RBS80_31605 [Thermoguttaceae bacterium]|nr:hypothetical protein [Thermoguttaceae bacterium]
MIAAIDQGIKQTDDDATLETLRESRGYLHNNRHQMRYESTAAAAYRLPPR